MKKNKVLDEIIRVNHAGEFGAQRIYSGQIKFTKDKKLKKTLQEIANQEEVHLKFFEEMMIQKRVRPTLMYPIWDIAGFSLGAITSVLGKDYVMACTEAVESVIVDHYRNQLDKISNLDEEKLKKNIEKFLKEEDGHREFGSENIENEDIKLTVFKNIIENITSLAIKVSQKI
tara:strand:- start:267 stop:785 length:519 start_codon:yes stop_codon:yes gene_type:complete